MRLSQTTRLQSGIATAWPNKGSKSQKSQTTSKSKAGPGGRLLNVGKGSSGKFVYTFAAGKAEGQEHQKTLLGGKGAGLHGMTRLGLPVPPGFTITTEVCAYFYDNKKSYPKALEKQIRQAMSRVETQMKRKFGDAKRPLLVSVRSGAAVSMPGMMDTVLNLGLNDKSVKGLIEESGDERFSYDSYRRFVSMYSDVVLGVHSNQFESVLEDLKSERGLEHDTDLSAEDLKILVDRFKSVVRTQGMKFPEDPWAQLWGAVGAVFGSWMSPRAITYRKLNSIQENLGTAVTVQSMVFGNMGDGCATGVAFTRDPSTGERRFFGEYLENAQGEDVVAGIRTPLAINKASCIDGKHDARMTLEKVMPKAYGNLVRVYQKLEKHHRDMQDIEFTIERGQLFLLQTRSGKRTAPAALRIACDMVREKLITREEAILRIDPKQLDQLLHPCLDPSAEKEILCRGLPASPGAATGQVVFDPDTAEKWAREDGKKVILVRVETSPEDIHGMHSAEGILTARGGMTSHAAVVARGMGKSCVAGCNSIKINYATRDFTVDSQVIREGDFITLDGATGEVIKGQVPTIAPGMNDYFQEVMTWVDDVRALGVRTNADTPADSQVAREFGAEGIGLCRTEHMFFDAERIDAVREMILADSPEGRERALKKILPMQRDDFYEIFKAMKGFPVTIRLLDPPLHEFIPHSDQELKELAQRIRIPYERLQRKAESLKEFNPMLGHRGCRLGVSFPEIYNTQVRAIMEAACELSSKESIRTKPEIMIPLIGDIKELEFVGTRCAAEADRVLAENPKSGISYQIGTMIELPRAALTAGEIARSAEFFSFGTNDLTQTTYGLSRDDSGLFLKDYLDAKIYDRDPFASLDQTGVGRLMEIALHEGRAARPDLKVGICGEHGGDPDSVAFCHRIGLDYVSCSPYRVPIARLAAAQAQIRMPRFPRTKVRVRKKKR